MRHVAVVPVMLVALCLFAGCEQDIADPFTGPAQKEVAQSPGNSVHVEGDRVPFFATNWMYSFDGYGVFYFYVADPSVIEGDRNLILLEGPSFDALGYEQTVTSESHYLMSQTPYSPKNFRVRGAGPVVFWFFTAAQADAMLADLKLTRNEMESYGPLKGWATMFDEETLIYPATTYSLVAHGMLEGGGEFSVNAHERYRGPGPFDAKWGGNIILKR